MQRIKTIWRYIVTHKWSKDILRANLLYILLIILFDLLFHFGLRPVGWGAATKLWLLMNLCLLVKLILDIIDKLIKRNRASY
ncbi:hypothetical protein [Limosilactobacillus panis]|uniref:Uncharacterized protein n=1 Tax=Limosilactobacillus panis TaxID=47493 RepID=A0ABT7VMD7_9LACO|nr:hypothetical protein [Limosilactobacillus panis]MDM8333900.1 hypothetical protein [Limosilactobacillus panis]HJA21226.1 hypothetical protein [Candidatus Limosilactobacillus intestinipullorum]